MDRSAHRHHPAGTDSSPRRRRKPLRLAIIDPTAGERARMVRLHPAAPRPVSDPTNPHWGLFTRAGRPAAERPADAPLASRPLIVDPTDPACDQPVA